MAVACSLLARRGHAVRPVTVVLWDRSGPATAGPSAAAGRRTKKGKGEKERADDDRDDHLPGGCERARRDRRAAEREKISLSDYIRVRLGLRGEGPQSGEDVIVTAGGDTDVRAQLAEHGRRLDALESERAAAG